MASIVIPSELDSYPLTLTQSCARALQPILRERRQSAEQSVNFAFRTATGLVRVPFIAAAVTILTQVRAGDADIVSVQIPGKIAGTLNVRDGVLGWTEIAQFAGVSSDAALSDEKLSVLTTWLRKRSVDVRLSFRCFGEFAASAESAKLVQRALSKASANAWSGTCGSAASRDRRGMKYLRFPTRQLSKLYAPRIKTQLPLLGAKSVVERIENCGREVAVSSSPRPTYAPIALGRLEKVGEKRILQYFKSIPPNSLRISGNYCRLYQAFDQVRRRHSNSNSRHWL